MKSIFFIAIFSCLLALACSDRDNPMNPGPGEKSMQIVDAFPMLDFNRPVDLQHHNDEKLFIVEQSGIIKVFNNNPSAERADIFLNIESIVDDRDNEEGLLGLAFHPNFIQNGYFYLNYTTIQGTTRVSRFKTDEQNLGVPSSELVFLEFTQPFGNHNGGQLAFGPDGYLYIGVGDGGSGGDPQRHGQNIGTLLGSILRIDIDMPSENLNYSIPASNPFFENQSGFRREIFAYGIRNPWRMSFDTETGLLWTGDVGQNEFEEIDIIENGGNYGWNVMEATNCFLDSNCEQSDLVPPYFSYNHDQGDASITGGLVYRGPITDLNDNYVYADYVSGRIWALETKSTNPENSLLFDTNNRITTFGTDHFQDLYFCSIDGKVYKIIEQ